MSFDLEDKRCWRPFFSPRFSRPKSAILSIEESELKYRSPDVNLSYELHAELTDSLKSAIRSWRRTTTCFNGDVSNRLDSVLEHLEKEKLNGITTVSQKYEAALQAATKGRKIFGVDLHLPFTSVTDIIFSVESTCIHTCHHPDVEFALGVKIFVYCCQVLSVRVFVCSLYP